MEISPAKTQDSDNMGAPFLREVKTAPRELIVGGDISSNNPLKSEKETDFFDPFPKEAETEASKSKQQSLPNKSLKDTILDCARG